MSQWQYLPDPWKAKKYVPVPFPSTSRSREKELGDLKKENAKLASQLALVELQLQELRRKERKELPEDFQLDLLRGRKIARLGYVGNTVRFTGVGMSGAYEVEGFAECLNGGSHEVPDEKCSCGFWVPEMNLEDVGYGRPERYWVLDVEFGGKVLECAKGAHPAPVRGYRAQWQRVLSVTAPETCAHCPLKAEFVCVQECNAIEALCNLHARVMKNCKEKPLTWVREHLATELIAPNLTDEVLETEVHELPPYNPSDLYIHAPTTPAWPIATTTTATPYWSTPMGTLPTPTYYTVHGTGYLPGGGISYPVISSTLTYNFNQDNDSK